MLVVIKHEEKTIKKKKKEAPPTLLPKGTFPISEEEKDKELFEDLRLIRKRLADQQAIPAYIVLSDKTLHLLVAQRPTTIEAFGMVSGIGEYKRDRYGKEFVEIIKKHVDK